MIWPRCSCGAWLANAPRPKGKRAATKTKIHWQIRMRFSCDRLSEKEAGEGAFFAKSASLPGIHGASLGLGRPGFPFRLPGQPITYRQSRQHAMLQSGFLVQGFPDGRGEIFNHNGSFYY